MKHRRYRRSISRLISLEDKHKTSSNTTDVISGDIVHDKKTLKVATFDDKNNLNEERIKRESDKVDTGKLIDEEEIETGKVGTPSQYCILVIPKETTDPQKLIFLNCQANLHTIEYLVYILETELVYILGTDFKITLSLSLHQTRWII